DELLENWFKASELQDDFDQQKIIESLLGAVALNIEEQYLLELSNERLNEEIMYEKLDEIRDEIIDEEFNERFEELDKTFDNMMKEILENRVRLNERTNEWLNKRLSEKENKRLTNKNDLPNESVLVELLENETFSKSLLKNNHESLLENDCESLLESDCESLLESELKICPSKRHKTSVLIAFTSNTNIQHMKFIDALLQSLLNNIAII
ncbi:3812_t:CDS:2, partial [Cetraspora pellucida]